MSEVTVDVMGENALMVRNNGSLVSGQAARYSKYDNIDYLVFSFGDGSGATLLTVFPDGTAVQTAHFTLRRNVAVSQFGSCEELS